MFSFLFLALHLVTELLPSFRHFAFIPLGDISNAKIIVSLRSLKTGIKFFKVFENGACVPRHVAMGFTAEFLQNLNGNRSCHCHQCCECRLPSRWRFHYRSPSCCRSPCRWDCCFRCRCHCHCHCRCRCVCRCRFRRRCRWLFTSISRCRSVP